jgi:hypothetical protein
LKFPGNSDKLVCELGAVRNLQSRHFANQYDCIDFAFGESRTHLTAAFALSIPPVRLLIVFCFANGGIRSLHQEVVHQPNRSVAQWPLDLFHFRSCKPHAADQARSVQNNEIRRDCQGCMPNGSLLSTHHTKLGAPIAA